MPRMYKIFIGIPTSRDYEPFWSSFRNFRNQLQAIYEVEVCIVKDKSIAEARNEIASRYLKSDSDYLLFLDDDHSGHTIAMFEAILDPILNNNSCMCGIKCYTKGFPYSSTLCIYSKSMGIDTKKLGLKEDEGQYVPIDSGRGYTYCDLVGFGMTLLTRTAFKVLKEPYFVSKDNRKEDNYFCDNLVKNGVQPVGCFDYVLEHNGIGSHNAYELREKGYAELKKRHPDMKVLVS